MPDPLDPEPVTPNQAAARAVARAGDRARELESLRSTVAKLKPRGADLVPEALLPIEEEAYALALAGRNPSEIACHISVLRAAELPEPWSATDASAAISRVSRQRQEQLNSSLSHHFIVDLDRLEAMVAALWPKAMAGDERAQVVVQNSLRRKAAMLGLDAPEIRLSLKANATGPDLTALSPEELRTYRDLVAKMEGTEGAPSRDVTPRRVKDRSADVVEMGSLPPTPRDPD